MGISKTYKLFLSGIFVLYGTLCSGQSDTYFAFPPLLEWQGGQHVIDLQISTSAPNSQVWIYNSDTSYQTNITVTQGNRPVSYSRRVYRVLGSEKSHLDQSARTRDAICENGANRTQQSISTPNYHW